MVDRRQLPPLEAAERIVAATKGLAAAKRERDNAIVDALCEGASVREVAKVAGMSDRQIQNIGHANGWPTASQKKRWAEDKAYRDSWMTWATTLEGPDERPQDPTDLP